jgi:transposase InsO family protein
MKQVYKIGFVSKQSFHKKVKRDLAIEDLKEQLLILVRQLREDHPGMSARTMYYKIKPECVGRDAFEALVYLHGYKLIAPRKFITTTDSTGVKRFPNLLGSIQITFINQVWVSDISYYWIIDRFYYLTVIMDLYSRFIVGYYVSESLRTIHTTIPAIKQALKTRGINHYNYKLILHSDGGGQYYCNSFLKLTQRSGIKNSMGKIVFDNSHAERVIQTIKNQYLVKYHPNNFIELKKDFVKAIQKYNFDRPHSSLKRLTPGEFEQEINNKQVDECPPMKVFASISTEMMNNKQKEKRSKKEKVYT